MNISGKGILIARKYKEQAKGTGKMPIPQNYTIKIIPY